MQQEQVDPKVIVALDVADASACRRLLEPLDPRLCRVKIGKELFTAAGPDLVREVVRDGFGVFLDLKFHDIPNTVSKACKAASDLGVWMLTIHASGGSRMMEAAREAIDAETGPRLVAVTVLTSLDDADLAQLGLSHTSRSQVELLASLAERSGVDGVVCSPQEVPALKKLCRDDFLFVTPGVRPQGTDSGDQRRVTTPAEAIAGGSSYLVIGRPITQADNPAAALQQIHDSLSGTAPVV